VPRLRSRDLIRRDLDPCDPGPGARKRSGEVAASGTDIRDIPPGRIHKVLQTFQMFHALFISREAAVSTPPCDPALPRGQCEPPQLQQLPGRTSALTPLWLTQPPFHHSAPSPWQYFPSAPTIFMNIGW